MHAKHGIVPEWANEALLDPDLVVLDPDPASSTGQSVRTIGYSATAGTLITVITVLSEGKLYGANGWRSSTTDQRRYREE